MRDLTSAWAIHLKGVLFVSLGMLSATLLIVDSPRAETALLLATCVWASARAYYWMFYATHHYVDASFRYSGIGSMVQYAWRRRHAHRRRPDGWRRANARVADHSSERNQGSIREP